MMGKIRIERGVFYLEDKPVFLLSADYPYYRDRVEHWDDRLKKIKEAGIDIITAYIPWRHHAHKQGEEIIYDFEGASQDNRNIKGFIKLAKKNNLYLILKPGPFIHGETNFGGLPDWVSPENDKEILPLTDFLGRAIERLGITMPSPVCEKFTKLVLEWLTRVDREIFQPIAHPKGNLIGIQLANEGLYTNGWANVSEYDYNEASLRLYQQFLKENYPQVKNPEPPKKIDDVNSQEGIFRLMAWSNYQAFYYRQALEKWAKAFSVDLPIMLNICGPSLEDIDSWFSRNVPEELEKEKFYYGYTDWVGIIPEDRAVIDRYLMFLRRARGFNLEDNWGFAKLYDERYAYPEVPFYQSLYTVALGASGFNVYTACATAHWDIHLDNQHEIPYPAAAPISEKGEVGEKYRVLQLMSAFFKEHGKDLVESSLYTPVSFGLYLPYAHICSWLKEKKDFDELKIEELSCAGSIVNMSRLLYDENIDFDLLSLTHLCQEEINLKKIIILRGGFFMDEKTQGKLSEYVKEGGNLLIVKELPKKNEHFKECSILADTFKEQGKGKLILIEEEKELIMALKRQAKLVNKIESSHKGLKVVLHEHKEKDIKFVFVFNEMDQERFVEFKIDGNYLGLNVAKKNASLVKIEGDSLKAILSKSKSKHYKSKINPKIALHNETFELDEPVDIYATKINDDWKIEKS